MILLAHFMRTVKYLVGSFFLHDLKALSVMTSMGFEFSFNEQYEEEIETAVCELYKAKDKHTV